MNLLFVCSRNKWRSRTAETIFKNHGTHQVRSAGTENSARRKLTRNDVEWADIIFAMEDKHYSRIIRKFGENNVVDKIIVLDIPDDYQYMDEELIDILRGMVKEYL